MPWPEVLELLSEWAKKPPPGEAIVSALKAFGFEWKESMPQTVQRRDLSKTKMEPHQLQRMGIKTFDQLPSYAQKLLQDSKEQVAELEMKKVLFRS